MIKIISKQAMLTFGKHLGEYARPGDLIFLFGELGAGKTTLTKGIALGLEINEEITSPTFQLMKRYCGRYVLNHLDLYRIQAKVELDIIVPEELLEEGITVVEWGKLLMERLTPSTYLEITIGYAPDFLERIVEIKPYGVRYNDLLRSLSDVNFGN